MSVVSELAHVWSHTFLFILIMDYCWACSIFGLDRYHHVHYGQLTLYSHLESLVQKSASANAQYVAKNHFSKDNSCWRIITLLQEPRVLCYDSYCLLQHKIDQSRQVAPSLGAGTDSLGNAVSGYLAEGTFRETLSLIGSSVALQAPAFLWPPFMPTGPPSLFWLRNYLSLPVKHPFALSLHCSSSSSKFPCL